MNDQIRLDEDIIEDMHIHTLQKSKEFTGIIEDETLRPHQSCQIFTKMIIFEYLEDVFIDIEKEMKFTIFMWEDLEIDDIYLMGEIAKFKDETYFVLNDLLVELKKYDVIPLNWVPKVNFKDNKF